MASMNFSRAGCAFFIAKYASLSSGKLVCIFFSSSPCVTASLISPIFLLLGVNDCFLRFDGSEADLKRSGVPV